MAQRDDLALLRRWTLETADRLAAASHAVDRLNVFPVADADTGTNLALTARAAADALDDTADHDLPGAARALARGALMGARGNSGVILAQVLLGAAEVVAAPDAPDGEALLRAALRRGCDQAWAAVSRPVEGTVLSVLRAAADAAAAAPEGAGCAAVARAAATAAADALAATPAQLPALARAGVVDAGGLGLLLVLDALAEALGAGPAPDRTSGLALPAGAAAQARGDGAGDEPCDHEVMYLLHADDGAVAALRDALEPLGESLLVVGGDGLWSVHLHVPVGHVGPAVEAGIEAGRPARVRVERLDVRTGGEPAPAGRVVLAVPSGDLLTDLLGEAGALVVDLPDGAAPSPAALLAAVRDTRAAEVVLLPLAPEGVAPAREAAALARPAGVTVSVVGTRAPVQALAALAVHDPQLPHADDVAAMSAAAAGMRHGEVAVAAGRALTSAGICEPGDVLGLVDGDVAVIGDDASAVAAAVLDRLLIGGGELVTLVGSPERTAWLVDYLRATRPSTETNLLDGGTGDRLLLVGVE